MSLALYTDNYWYPSGALASNVQARIFQRHTNTLASIFADAAGTTPLPNPLTTTAGGVLTFYASMGDYWIHIGRSSFQVAMDDDGVIDQIWASMYVHQQAAPSAVWNINHSLGVFPSVDVLDSSDTVVYADVQHMSISSLTVTFASPTTGRALLRR